MDEAYALLGIGLCLFGFLLVLLGVGSFYGGDWQTVAQGVAPYFVLIVVFAFGVFVLIKWMGS